MTYKIEISGFKTEEQAQAFYNWYKGQGEANIPIWLGVRTAAGCTHLNTDLTIEPVWEENTLKFSVKPS